MKFNPFSHIDTHNFTQHRLRKRLQDAWKAIKEIGKLLFPSFIITPAAYISLDYAIAGLCMIIAIPFILATHAVCNIIEACSSADVANYVYEPIKNTHAKLVNPLGTVTSMVLHDPQSVSKREREAYTLAKFVGGNEGAPLLDPALLDPAHANLLPADFDLEHRNVKIKQ